MSEGTQNPTQTQEQQYLQQAQDFYGQSMGRMKGQMQSDSAQLESIMQQLPEESQAQIQEMTDSYAQFEGSIDQAAQDAGVQDAVDQAAQQERQSDDEAAGQVPIGRGRRRPGSTAGAGHRRPSHRSGRTGCSGRAGYRWRAYRSGTRRRRTGTDQVGQVADQAQGAVGDAADQAQDMAGQMAESLPEGYEALGQPFTDDQGNTILQGQDEEGNTAIVRRGTDEAGNTVDSIFDAQGELLDENIVEEAAEEGEEPEDVAGQMAESLPEGYEALGQPFTDDQGNTILQGQDEEGNTVIVRRATDEEGNTIDSIFNAQGELLDEEIVEEPAEDEEPVDEATQMAESLPEGYKLVGEPTTDEEGRTVLTGEDEQGNTVTIRREVDDAGNVWDRVYDAQGNLMDERAVENPAPPGVHVHDHDPTLRAGGQLRRLFVAGQ